MTATRGWRAAAQFGGLALAVYALTLLSLKLPEDGRLPPIWLPNALVLACLLRNPLRQGWRVVLAALCGNIAAALQIGDALPLAILLGGLNTVEVVVCRVVLVRLLPRGLDPAEPKSLGLLAVAAAGSALAVLPASGLLALNGYGAEFLVFVVRWASHVFGLVVLTPCLLIFNRWRSYAGEAEAGPFGVAALVAYGGALLLAFGQTRYPLFFLAPPLLLVVGMELGLLGAAAGVAALVTAAMLASHAGGATRAFVIGALAVKVGLVQAFITMSSLSGLVVASFGVQRRRLKTSLLQAWNETREQMRRAVMAEEIAETGYWRVDLESFATTWSPGMYRLTGRDPAVPVDFATAWHAIHPDDVAESQARWDMVLATGGTSPNATVRMVRPDGDIRHLAGRMTGQCGPDGKVEAIFGVLIDVTEQKRTEMTVAESEARFRMLAESTPDVIVRLNAERRFIYVSPSARQVLGYEPQELVGQFGPSSIHPEDERVLLETMDKLRRGQKPLPATRLQHRRRRKDGSYVWLEGNPTILQDENGELTEIIDVLRDITVQKAMETELQAARDAAEAAAEVKSQFLANMTHELRTPLTAVLGFSSLLAEQPELGETAQAYVAKLNTAGKALLSIVNDVLDFSKLEAGQLEIASSAMCPADLVREAADLFAFQIGAKGIALTVSGCEDLPARVLADSDRLRQILLNLIGNAVKFTDAGEVRVEVRHLDGKRLEVVVADTGPGLSRSQTSRLFQRFSQVDGSSTRRHGGTGLGLAICKGLVEAMGGEIGVRSRPGHGSSFWFVVPAPPASAPEAAAGMAEPRLAMPAAGLRLLVADDHPVNRQLVRAILEPFGVEVSEAADGREAVEAALRRPFDLILMDIRMPEADGVSAMTSIRECKGPNRSIPILAFSAGGDKEGVGAMDPGFDGQVAKPLTASDLLSAVAGFTVQPLAAGRANERS
ncbi:MAG TPA: ATP-binding protein [Caulobacteraceae bacterium]|jgi:PAS domain S-box-containing protein|nr:ATP-binding protein [Caulobacteraceae bacterium]